MIDANKEKVWQILMDVESYPEWNQYILKIGPAFVEGEKIKAFAKPPGSPGLFTRAFILKVDQNRELRWVGKFWIPYVFSGQHVFEIRPEGENRVKFVQYEYFSGLFTPIHRIIRKNQTRKGFILMNENLKAKAEGIS